MKSLEERLAEKKEEYDKLVLAEYKAQRFVDMLTETIQKYETAITVYESSAYLYIYPKDIEQAELTLIPAIATITGEKWKKNVSLTSVEYGLSIYESGYYFRIQVQPKVEGTCRIVAHATGKMKKRMKYVEVEEPEVEYLVDCGDIDETTKPSKETSDAA